MSSSLIHPPVDQMLTGSYLILTSLTWDARTVTPSSPTLSKPYASSVIVRNGLNK